MKNLVFLGVEELKSSEERQFIGDLDQASSQLKVQINVIHYYNILLQYCVIFIFIYVEGGGGGLSIYLV